MIDTHCHPDFQPSLQANDGPAIPLYPQVAAPVLGHRSLLHPLFSKLTEGLSELTFANLYLFRHRHAYRFSTLPDGHLIVLGNDDGQPFFILPFGLPEPALLDTLFREHRLLKCISSSQSTSLEQLGYAVIADRDNFDYLYRRQDLAALSGRNYHKKRNLIKAFMQSNTYTAKPLRSEFRDDALQVLDEWRQGSGVSGDYEAAREALNTMESLQLCGGIYYVDSRPVAYVLGEELAGGTTFVIHFEKAVPGYKGLYQFINQSFAAILPEVYEYINREQDLGEPGLRQAKLSYLPAGFVEKFKAVLPATP